jgi:hypothetical protein
MPEEVAVEQTVTEPLVQEEQTAEVKTEATDPPALEAESQEVPRDEKGKFKSPVQSRIDELTRARHEAEREAAYWKQRATPEVKNEPVAKPTPDKFEDYGAYVEALTDWKTDQKVNEAISKRDAEAAQAADHRLTETRQQTFAERQSTVKATIQDYDAVVGAADIPIAPHVGEAILESEKGPELVYHLAKHPEIAEKLSRMSIREADREIGRLEAQLTTPAKPVTKAPAPMKPTAGTGTTVTTDPRKMSMEEYKSFREKQGARWAK